MPTIHEDIENLDRLFEDGAAKDVIRSQIRLIDREVAALEADYASLAKAKAQSDDTALKAKEDCAAAVKAYDELKAAQANPPHEPSIPEPRRDPTVLYPDQM